jgi:hypothetical protein
MSSLGLHKFPMIIAEPSFSFWEIQFLKFEQEVQEELSSISFERSASTTP